nr:hypothetical protein [Planomicrobium sp. MB-3u-38]
MGNMCPILNKDSELIGIHIADKSFFSSFVVADSDLKDEVFDPTEIIIHTFPLEKADEAYKVFDEKREILKSYLNRSNYS